MNCKNRFRLFKENPPDDPNAALAKRVNPTKIMLNNTSSAGDITEMPAATTSACAPVETTITYQAPAIESVVTFDDLQREVLYAGSPTTNNPPVP